MDDFFWACKWEMNCMRTAWPAIAAVKRAMLARKHWGKKTWLHEEQQFGFEGEIRKSLLRDATSG
jgi:hypothetical protein